VTTRWRRRLAVVLLLFAGSAWSSGIAGAQVEPGAQVIRLWPEGVPGAREAGAGRQIVDGRVVNVHDPTLTFLPPTGPSSGTAVIVCPGGGYGRLAIANEAAGVAERLRPLGVAVFVLEYRLKEYGHPAPLQDVVRAIRWVRARAGDFGVRPDRVGVMGASAGGHLAAGAATLHDAPEVRTGAALDTVSGRPDFVALLYPVITMEPPFAHAGSRENLIGATASPDLVKRLSLEHQVRPDMPPVFLVHTIEDRSVPVENSLRFFEALRRHGVSAELHVYEAGPHGFGTRQDLGTTSGWFERWVEWMRAHGWLQNE
jgi:acetyl esterase/lipase